MNNERGRAERPWMQVAGWTMVAAGVATTAGPILGWGFASGLLWGMAGLLAVQTWGGRVLRALGRRSGA